MNRIAALPMRRLVRSIHSQAKSTPGQEHLRSQPFYFSRLWALALECL